MPSDISDKDQVIVGVLKMFRQYADKNVHPHAIVENHKIDQDLVSQSPESVQFLEILLTEIRKRSADELEHMYSRLIVESSEEIWNALDKIMSDKMAVDDVAHLARMFRENGELLGVITEVVEIISDHIVSILLEIDAEGGRLFNEYSTAEGIQGIIDDLIEKGTDITGGND